MTIIYEICTHSSLFGTKWEKGSCLCCGMKRKFKILNYKNKGYSVTSFKQLRYPLDSKV